MHIFESSMKSRKATRILLLVMLGLLLAGCKQETAALSPSFDGENALRLAAEQVAFGPRYPGSPGHASERAWIADQLQQLGWQVDQACFTYRDVELCNIFASRRSGTRAPLVLLGAHYDTRRVADSDPAQPEMPVPGANDGASGVAVLLELARVMQPSQLAYDVRLAFFDGEDQGRLDGWPWSVGAEHAAENLPDRPLAVIVVDMVGDRDLQLYREQNSDPALAEDLWQVARTAGFAGFIDLPKHAIIDDHLPFARRGIPAVDVIDIEYTAWHTTQDTLDKLSPGSLYQVGRTLQLWLEMGS